MTIRREGKFIIHVTEACYDEIRKKLVALGDGGTIVELSHSRCIDMHDVIIETRGAQRAATTTK